MSQIGVVCVPFIRNDQHVLYALQTVLSLQKQQTDHVLDFVAVVNECREDPNDLQWIGEHFEYEINDVNNLARAWNRGIKKAFERGAEYALVLNLDVILHPRCIENLVDFYRRRPEAFLVSPREWAEKDSLDEAPLGESVEPGATFSCFLIDRKLSQHIGTFDEQFGPAYHEDSDMMYRMKLAQCPFFRISSALYWHMECGTLKGSMANNDEKFLMSLRVAMNECMVRYEKKWGGLPGHETFKTPYNQ